MNVPDDSLTPSESTVQHDAPDTETVAARGLSTSERAPFWSLRLHARETFAHSLVIVPSMYLLGAVLLGIAIPAIDRGATGGGLLGVTPGEAQSIMESIAAGMVRSRGWSCRSRSWSCSSGRASIAAAGAVLRSDAVIKNALGLFVAPGCARWWRPPTS